MEYTCRIATIEDMEKNWTHLKEIHPNNNAWKVFKEESIKNMKAGNTIVYYGVLNGQIISEITASINSKAIQNSEGLIDDTTAYLSGFRTLKEYRGKGYFSILYRFVEKDLMNRGYTRLTLGVEPSETTNKLIYTKYGFTEYIKTDYELQPASNENDPPIKVYADYYAKTVKRAGAI